MDHQNNEENKNITIADVAEALEETFLDGNLMADEIPIDWQRDTSDGGDHLNYSGACNSYGVAFAFCF